MVERIIEKVEGDKSGVDLIKLYYMYVLLNMQK